MDSNPPLTDSQLVTAIVQRDQQALAQLYDRYGGKVFAVALRVVGNRHDAEEITLDVFSEFWEKSERFNPARSAVRTYLINLTRSRAIDRLRWNSVRGSDRGSSQPSVVPEQALPGHEAPPDAAAMAAEASDHLANAICRLGMDQRRALHLSYFEGLSHREIAERMKIPLGTVKTFIRQAVQQLREALRSSDLGDPP